MSRFGDDPLTFFDRIYTGAAPWDIGGPQPALAGLIERFPPGAVVLDVGCGSGDLAIHLAGLGCRVLGIDFAPGAIDQARARAARLPEAIAGRLEFQVADGLSPAALGRRFEAVFDSGFFHLFDPDPGAAYIREVAGVIEPGGHFYLHAFAIEFDIPNVPRAVSETELRALFTAETGWEVLALESAEFHSRVAPPVAGICACAARM